MQLETALHILGIEDLRPFQKEALNTLLTGRNLLTLMPTSAGKSLIFTSFAMVQERLTIVIEPHLALELDQVRQLHDKGVAAACLNSLHSSAERKSVLAQIEQGELLLLFVTPEMLQNRKVQTALRQADPAGIMIDEAHASANKGPAFARTTCAFATSCRASRRLRWLVHSRRQLRQPPSGTSSKSWASRTHMLSAAV